IPMAAYESPTAPGEAGTLYWKTAWPISAQRHSSSVFSNKGRRPIKDGQPKNKDVVARSPRLARARQRTIEGSGESSSRTFQHSASLGLEEFVALVYHLCRKSQQKT